eukprot:TRINITY_DN6519_c0_g1_i1.p1 TRINITY_DN6519_c0_g1~~TRINITY_DN6519_c0_g1_i1.p1  ORF type:complete len:256 (-),score=36.07 TRINITY_DN6519_c0_g1_i1:625-1392(-)
MEDFDPFKALFKDTGISVPDQKSASLPDSASEADQLQWILNWLNERKLFKTQDQLLSEFGGELLDESADLISNPIVEKFGCLDKIHKSSILSVRFHPTKPWVVTTDTAKNLIITNFESGNIVTSKRENNPFLGSIISLEFNTQYPDLLVIGTMDNKHALLKIEEIDGNVTVRTLQKYEVHTHYVIRTKWSYDGKYFASASHDCHICLFKMNDDMDGAELIKKISFPRCVEAIEFTQVFMFTYLLNARSSSSYIII